MSSKAKILNEIALNKPAEVNCPPSFVIESGSQALIDQFLEVLHVIGGKGRVIENWHEVLFCLQQQIRDGVEVVNGIETLAPYNIKEYGEKKASELGRVHIVYLQGGTAVAENGAIWLTEKAMANRSLPFICQELVLVIREEDIVANMHQAYSNISVDEDGYGVFIAGPSKTADIEQSLVIGAHGPLKLQVLILKKKIISEKLEDMKLIRYHENGKEKPGVILDNEYYDVSPFGEDYNEQFFETDGLNRLQSFLNSSTDKLDQLSGNVRLACPIARPSKIICIGLNYSDHARETKAAIPTEPILFFKSTTALAGPNDDIVIPKSSKKTDWEVELAVVIGKRATYVNEAEAMHHVAGYCLHNDLSEREFQLERNGQWVKGKSCDTFAPMGPYLATKEEIHTLDNLRLWLKVNGKLMQDGNTSNLIFKVPFLVSYISQFMTLLPGDVISTGTPAGVGLGMNPQVYLKEGDVVELGIDGLGSAKQKVVAYAH